MKNRGFSIIEVMFAIMILGIGFIMVAAMFPVAIQQSQTLIDESTGRSVASAGAVQAANIVRALPPAELNTSGAFHRIAELTNAAPAHARDMINSSVVYESDRRFGWTTFHAYRDDAATNPARAYTLISVALRTRTISEQSLFEDAIGYSGYPGAVWQSAADGYDNASVRCRVTFEQQPGTVGQVRFLGSGANYDQAAGSPSATGAAVDGGIIITRGPTDGGRVFYIAEYDPVARIAELAPKSDALPADMTDVEVILLGRGLLKPNRPWVSDPLDPNYNPREGPSQVIGVYRMDSALR